MVSAVAVRPTKSLHKQILSRIPEPYEPSVNHASHVSLGNLIWPCTASFGTAVCEANPNQIAPNALDSLVSLAITAKRCVRDWIT